MRTYTDLSGSFRENKFEGGAKNITLPLILPFEGIAEKLVFECAFTPPEDSAQNCFFLELQKLSGKFDIFCNGEHIASFKRVYAGICCELTDAVTQAAENIIRIEVLPTQRADGFFSFGGAGLLMTDKTHFALPEDGDCGMSVRTVMNDGAAHINIKAQIENPNNYDVAVFTLYDRKGRPVETKTAKPTAAAVDFILEAPELWDGPHSPALYSVQALIQRDTVYLDQIDQSFGIRDFSLGKDGFFRFNGIKDPLCGITLTDFSRIDDDFEVLNELDANCVRFKGLPADCDILSRCDEAGILAWIDIPVTQSDEDIDEIRGIAKNAALHPSVAVIGTSAKDPSFAKKWCTEVKTCSVHAFAALSSDIFSEDGILDAVPDILSVEMNAGVGLNDFSRFETRLSEIRELHPEFRLAVSALPPECIIDRHSANAVRSDCSQEYFSAWHERFWNTFCSQKNMIGVFAGTLSDTAPKTKRTGLVTFDREEKKDAFWFYRAQFSASGFVRLCSAGQTSVTSKYTDIKCYSNKPTVRLSVNGKVNEKYVCEKLSDCVYIFRGIKLKRRNNTIVVTSDGDTDSEVIFRSRSRLSKK